MRGRPFDHRAVWRLVARVPRGKVVTYGQVAVLLGAPRAARQVGSAMKRCPPGVPWHRVLNARGGISRRPNLGAMLTQRVLLEQEGIRFRRGRADLERDRWAGPAGRPGLLPALSRS
jgi:methylated-DNA-protein-cysteine methyltransferase-like protein